MAQSLMNKTQEGKAIVASLSEQIDSAAEACILAGEWPRSRPLPVARYDGEFYSAMLWYDKTGAEWVLRRTSKLANGHTFDIRSKSRTELLSRLLDAWADTTAENAEIDRQNAAMAVEDEDPETREALDFVHNYREGQRYKHAQEFLSKEECDSMYDMIRSALKRTGSPFTANNIAVAHNELLDRHDPYWNLFVKAQNEEKRQIEAAQAEEAEAALLAPLQSPVEAENPFVNSGRRPKTNLQNVEGVPGRNKIAPTPENLKALRREIMTNGGGFGKR